jgi:murein DD-endopeptidase MepM/ murein hydrolase activator NlpD
MRHPTLAITLASALALVACSAASDAVSATTNGTPTTTSHQPIARDTITPRLVDLGITFAPYDPTTGRAGAFDLTLPLGAGPLGGFGRTVSDPNGNLKSLPSYDYYVQPGTVVRAPFDGVVTWVQRQDDSKDYEILVGRTANSEWWFDYDHLSTALVDSGATVRAGQPIGVVRSFMVDQPGGPREVGFVELMIGNYATKNAYCPLALADSARADSLASAVRRLLVDWRALGHQTPDTTAMVRPGCFTATEVP